MHTAPLPFQLREDRAIVRLERMTAACLQAPQAGAPRPAEVSPLTAGTALGGLTQPSKRRSVL